MPPSHHATQILPSPCRRAPLAPFPLAPSSSTRPRQAQEGFWSGVRERLGSASPPICCRLGAAALACLVQDQWDGERPSPILTPTPGQVERRKRRAIEPLYGGETLGLLQREFPPRAPGPSPELAWVALLPVP